MGFYDNLANNSFKEMPDGISVYYPNGIFGKGRIVPSDSVREKLFNFQKRTIKYGVPIGALLGIFVTLRGGLLFLLPFLLIPYLQQYYLIKDLSVHNSKITAKEAIKKSKIPDWYIKMLKIMAGVLLLIGVPLLLAIKVNYYFLTLIICIGVLGYGVAIYMDKIKNE